jgi:peptide chain release factor 2
MSRLKILKDKLYPWEELLQASEDLTSFYQMAVEEKDEGMADEIAKNLSDLENKYSALKVKAMLSDELDPMSVFLTIHSGAGGTEACDWASMLYRMYTRWAERHGYKVEVVDLQEAEGGIKSATIEIDGEYAFGYLKNEVGIHRLVRISPFDSAKRRHTSFASIYANPVLDDTIEVDIRPEDIRIDTYRAGGAGGQHINKTDSAVRITHLETNIVVQCQNERSQHKNKAFAMSMLKSKLYEHYKAIQEEEAAARSQEKKDISWGHQIRSYVFHPYNMVKDHRTKAEVGNIQAVMDGEIDYFIEEFLKSSWIGTQDDDDEE